MTPTPRFGIITHFVVNSIANNNRGGARRSTKRRAPKRNSAPKSSSAASLVSRGNAAGMSRIPGLGFPHSMLTNLRYVDTYALTITSGSLAKQVMRWNSVFDPDLTGTGHQPLYRDTYASIYDQYAVVSASIEVKIVNSSTTAVLLCGIVGEDDASSSSTPNTLCEQATGQHTILPPLAGSLSSHTFRMNWDCKKMLHIDPFTSETYKTAVGSNPTEESDLVIWATNFDASSESVTVHVTLVQTILWTELTSPTQS